MAVKNLFNVDVEPELTRPSEQFGDFSTNIALQLAGKLQQNPVNIAQQLTEVLTNISSVSRVEIAGPGFINFTLSDALLAKSALSATELPKSNEGKEILVEFGDPNPFKEMHIGHLYSYIVGDSICRLLESSGANVRRLSYHGDVGLHVAKAIWGMKNSEINFDTDKVSSEYIGQFYAKGSAAYDKSEDAKSEINSINEHIYNKDDPDINRLYEWGRQRSFVYFDEVLGRLGVKSDKRYLESQSADAGMELVHRHTGAVFKQSDGAIIYEGEKAGFHTRVFITSKGLPTYETKDLGLAELKNQDYPTAAQSIIITASEQTEYFKVMLAALRELDTQLAEKTKHLAHGFLSLSTGKMSSRTGEVYSAAALLADVESTAKQAYPSALEEVHLGAAKYGFLKHRLGTDIAYNVEESVSLEGNSGPYLQYAHARACSILDKAAGAEGAELTELDQTERSLARKISQYPEAVSKATEELMPHHIANYLYELAQNFNRFYEISRIIGDDRQNIRLKLTKKYQEILKHGLSLLGIFAPERM